MNAINDEHNGVEFWLWALKDKSTEICYQLDDATLELESTLDRDFFTGVAGCDPIKVISAGLSRCSREKFTDAEFENSFV